MKKKHPVYIGYVHVFLSHLIDEFILLQVFWEIFSNQLGHSIVLPHEQHVHAADRDDDDCCDFHDDFGDFDDDNVGDFYFNDILT